MASLRIDWKPRWRPWLAVVLAGLCEWPFLQALGTNGRWIEQFPGSALLWHLVAVGVLFLFAEPRGRSYFAPERRHAQWGALSVAFLPLIGWGVAVGLTWWRHAVGSASLDDALDPMGASDLLTAVPAARSARERRLQVLEGLDVLPFAEILAGTDEALKRGAVQRLAVLRTSDAIALLLHHRRDPNLSIRFAIAATLEQIKKDFDEALDAARQELRRGPFKVSARILMAKVYWQYVTSGLLDPETARAYTQEAREHLTAATRTPYANASAYWLLVELHRRARDWSAALTVLEQLAAQPEMDSVAVHQARAECLFADGQYHAVPAAIAAIPQVTAGEATWRSLGQWWGVKGVAGD
ncbi:MAG: hypothetical protein HY696_02115 [Deltaproteobacteria bacterium]|nr:hypothetical protein [Deltaproteobacteria bacterium]